MKNENARYVLIKNEKLLNVLTLVVLICGGIGLGLLNLYFGTGKYNLQLLRYYLDQPALVLLNVLPFILLVLILWLLSNRSWVAFLIAGVFCLVYSWASYWKLMARSDPIYASDLAVIGAAAQMSRNYITITHSIIYSAVLVLIGTLLFVFVFNGRLKRRAFRWGGFGGLILSCALLYSFVYTSWDIYESFKLWDGLNQWIACDNFISRGSMYPFLYSIQSASNKAPEGYSKKVAQAILESYDEDDIQEEKKVSVICFMLEAFSDLSDATDMLDGDDAYETYHQICDESICGRLVSNVFAGGTINTERCVITGAYELESFRQPAWSYARYFTSQGYTVQGGHPGRAGFYNRVNINENLGFSDFLFHDNYFCNLVTEGLARDNVFMPEMTRLLLEEVAEGNPVFSFNTTYQNHGPYSDSEIKFEKEYISLENAGSNENYCIINNYLAGVEDTAQQLRAMMDTLNESDEPVVLMFFGDHKPWLGEQSVCYEALGIDMDSGSEESFYNHYGTEYVIWANDAAKEVLDSDFVGTGPDLSPCFLMNELFTLCGWDGPAFMKLSKQVQAETPVIGSNEKYLYHDFLCAEEDLPETAKDLLQQMGWVQYYQTKMKF